jgi:stage III sporulation protein AH
MNHLSKIKLAPEEPVTVAMAPLPLETHSLADPVEEKKRLFSSWKPFPWREALKSKNMLIGACVLLIVVAAYLNIRFSAPSTPPIDEANNDPSEENGDQNTNTNDESNYFAVAVINRERVRDEALDLLQTVAESEESTVEAREEAYTEMSRIASEITYEINIENLVRSKGFEECIAVINGNEINVVVKSDGLSMSEVAQIKEIVYLTSGILPDNIKIIEKQ